MAKKPVRRTTRSAAASSSKTGKASAKSTAKTAKRVVSYKKKSARAKSSKKVNYKEQYIKLLEKTNKTLTKEVSAIRKAIEKPQPQPQPKQELPADFEAFPYEEPTAAPSVQTRPSRGRGVAPLTIEEEILGKLSDIEMELRARDSQFDDLVHGSPKLTGGGFND